MILPHVNGVGKSPRIRKATSIFPLVETLHQELLAGGSLPCTSCLTQISLEQIGALALYMPHDGSDPIPYTVCTTCIEQAEGDETKLKALAEHCERICMGGVRS